VTGASWYDGSWSPQLRSKDQAFLYYVILRILEKLRGSDMTDWDEKMDIIVIGSGLAGLAAAIEAAQTGASVIVLEKMKVVGGNTRISDGALAAPLNYLQKKLGIEDSTELFYEDMLRAGLNLNHPQLVEIVAERAAETIEWTIELGVEYLDRLDRFGGHSVARSLTTKSHSGLDIIKAQTATLNQLGVEIRTRCLLTDFIADGGGTTVSGVNVRTGYQFPDKNSGIRKKIGANCAVILATGGFGYDLSFCKLQRPGLADSTQSTNHRGATADGIVAALNIGALPVHLSWLQMGPWGCPDEKAYGKGGRFASYSVYPAGILIDPATGCRILNEWADRRERSEAILKAGHPCIGVVDSDGAEMDLESLKDCLKSGKVKAFENLSDLAQAYGIPCAPLNNTLNDYNMAIVKGMPDEFRKPLDQGAQQLKKPPFYAMRLWPKLHYTPGGIGINSKAQVINLAGQPIAGLFAAGEVCGGIHGASRLSACALTECLVFGRIAGQEAASLKHRI
jgi:flavocytochrome c